MQVFAKSGIVLFKTILFAFFGLKRLKKGLITLECLIDKHESLLLFGKQFHPLQPYFDFLIYSFSPLNQNIILISKSLKKFLLDMPDIPEMIQESLNMPRDFIPQ